MNDSFDKYYLKVENLYEQGIKAINQYQVDRDCFKSHSWKIPQEYNKLNFNKIIRLEDKFYR